MQPSEDGGGGVPAERAIVAVGVAPGSATAADAAAHAADANGAAPPEPEPEPEPAPAPAPVVVDDLLIGLDDGERQLPRTVFVAVCGGATCMSC